MKMREINEIIVHCADTKTSQDFDIEDIRRWHTDPKPKGRGWSDVGYHYYIKLNGKLQIGRPIERSGAHCSGRNKNSVGVCFEGGKDQTGEKWNNPTTEQFHTFKGLKTYLFLLFGEVKISGHYEYSSKSCPNFDIGILK